MNAIAVSRELREALDFLCCVEFWRMGVFWTISLLASYLALLIRRILGQNCFYRRCVPSRIGVSKPLCVVTGATSGLGEAAALALSRKGFFVVLASQSPESLEKAMERIRKQNGDAQLKAFELDVSSFSSILKFKCSLEKWLSGLDMHPSIQLLINNAGILATSKRLTTEGYDQMMSTNYIGPFCLTKLLLPLLMNSPVNSRIVNVTSFTHRSVFSARVDKETVGGKCFWASKTYQCAQVYEYSKLCVLLFTYQLHREIHSMDESHRVSVNAADPGVVETNIMREIPSYLSQIAYLVFKLLGVLQSPEKGIGSILDASLAPPETSGVYFFGGKGRTLSSSALSHNPNLAENLWNTSLSLFEEFASKEKGAQIS